MLKERIDDLVDILADEFSRIENTFLIRNNQQLVKYLQNPEKWKSEQLAHKQQYKKELARIGAGQIKVLNEKYNKVLLLAYKEVDKDIITIQEKEIIINSYQKEIKAKMQEMAKVNSLRVAELVNMAYKTYERTVRLIGATYKTDQIFEGIKKQMPKGIQNGLKITYKDGKQMTFKSYMEMNARTTLQQETLERQNDVGKKANQIFYVCDVFPDCAKDHADYQGKIYYDADVNIPDEVQRYIDTHHIMSKQEVCGEPIRLVSRWNCRHNLHAISTDDVLGGMSGDKIAEQEGFKFGKYEEKNYDDLQQQRYNERQIRKWKTRLENQEQIDKTTGITNARAIAIAKSKISEWQGKQRDLIKSNPEVLKRDYDRENAKIIVEDLGVKYRYKVVDGELKKK